MSICRYCRRRSRSSPLATRILLPSLSPMYQGTVFHNITADLGIPASCPNSRRFLDGGSGLPCPHILRPRCLKKQQKPRVHPTIHRIQHGHLATHTEITTYLLH
jgi:hypothetical protein